MNKFSNSLGPTSVRTNNLRQLIRKCPALTLAVQTSPTARLHLHHHGGALSRQVLKVSEISAVPTCRRLAAPRTGAYFRSDCRDHPTIAVPLDRKNPRAWPGSPIHVFSHTRLSARRPIKPTSTESEADPLSRYSLSAQIHVGRWSELDDGRLAQFTDIRPGNVIAKQFILVL